MNSDVTLSVSESKGPIPARLNRYTDPTGETVEYKSEGRATACPGCGQPPVEGEIITKIFFRWWHGDCGAKHLRESGANHAWVALGLQLERAPSKFTNAETKAIVRNLLRMCGSYALAGEDDEEEPEYVGGSEITPGLRVIEGGRHEGPDPWESASVE
ncbi:hypothetical protein OG884_18705 [Streptosporangium sp. NBC_01755]|uniref:hypothetical protein n=1 Tax=unclassified Streptosporangium TaxID=2632669 RepID=UPI002DDC0B5C|nr:MULTISPECIES: hypothetical protein [unclassified Streptosporangium]WSA23701.1 hypothetical protein OIE13_22430 [Streptosporangium sp. NBC_01810]WSD03839.1 hypothetical protein OG884_18705 [Streptosporangium sp. NBC_01755]